MDALSSAGWRAADFGRDRLEALLEYAVGAQDFFAIRAGEIEAAIGARTAEGGAMFEPADAPVSYIAVALAARRHAVTLHASAFAAGLYPGIAGLQRFRAVEVRLLTLLAGLRDRAG